MYQLSVVTRSSTQGSEIRHTSKFSGGVHAHRVRIQSVRRYGERHGVRAGPSPGLVASSMRRLAGVKRKVWIGFSQCQNLPFLPVRKSVPASRRDPVKGRAERAEGVALTGWRDAKCSRRKEWQATPHLLYLPLSREGLPWIVWISLPGFHSHCFSSPIFGLRACWVPFL